MIALTDKRRLLCNGQYYTSHDKITTLFIAVSKIIEYRNKFWMKGELQLMTDVANK